MHIPSNQFDYVQLPNLFSGKLPADTFNATLPEENKANLKVRIIHLCPGNNVGRHQHKEDWEMFYMLKGTVEIDDNGIQRTLRPGDVAIWAGGDYHAVRNISEETAEYLAIVGKNAM